MKTLILLILSALALAAQTPKESIVIRVTDSAGVLTTAKITGIPAAAGLDTLTQFLATQTDVVDNIVVPRYENVADLVKKLVVKFLREIAPKFPSSQTKADVDEIEAKIAALEAKRDALFAAALAEK